MKLGVIKHEPLLKKLQMNESQRRKDIISYCSLKEIGKRVLEHICEEGIGAHMYVS